MSLTAKTHVIGFVFDAFKQRVLLIEKQRPHFMKGQWNGIGGKIELGETSLEAMRREALEESGLRIDHWRHMAVFDHEVQKVSIDVFCAETELVDQFEQRTDERLALVPVQELRNWAMVGSAFTLCHMALERSDHVWPFHLTERYPS